MQELLKSTSGSQERSGLIKEGETTWSVLAQVEQARSGDSEAYQKAGEEEAEVERETREGQTYEVNLLYYIRILS